MIRAWIRSYPLPLLRSVLILAVAGVFFIYSSSFRDALGFAERQMVWIAIGGAALLMTVKLGYRFFLGISYSLYVWAIALLAWVAVAGEVRYGAQRWIELGFFSFQPSEFAKLVTAMAVANYLGSRNTWEGEGKAVLGTLGLVGLPLFMILKQPDLGSALMLVPMTAVLLFLWGLRYRYFITALLGGLLASPVLWNLLKDYQKKRILVFLNPSLDPLGAGYTAIQSRIAVGSGGLFGKGWLHGTQSQLDFVPEHHTDFIFSVIAEEMGFVGAVSLILLYGALFFQIMQIIDRTTDMKGKLLSAAILSLLFSQMLINIGMSFGFFPVTGITLPFISYGGSSLVVTFVAAGLLVSIYKERSIF